MKTLGETIDLANRLAAEGTTQSKRGQWTLAQLCDHLAKTMDGSCPGGDLGPPLFSRWLRALVKRAILWTRYMPSGAAAPKLLIPDDGLSTEEGIDRLTRAVERFENLSEQDKARMTPSPALGPMTYKQWHRLHLIHTNHHFKRFTG